MSDIDIKLKYGVATVKANSREAQHWLWLTRTKEFLDNPTISREYVDEFEAEAREAGLDVKLL